MSSFDKIDDLSDKPTIIIARADAWSDVAKAAGLKSDSYDAYCIVTQPKRVYVLGNSEAACATRSRDICLRHWGLSLVCSFAEVVVHAQADERVDQPQSWPKLPRSTRAAFGTPTACPVTTCVRSWKTTKNGQSPTVLAGVPMQTGHSYGNIILRNKDEFELHIRSILR